MSPPRFVAILLLALAGTAPARADLDPLIPPDTESYISINVRQVVDSPLFQKQFLAPIRQALDEAGSNKLKGTLKDLGVDPFKDIERLTMASPGGVEADRGIIVAHGSFDAAKFKTKAEEAARDAPEALKLHDTPLGGGAKHHIYEVVIPNQDSSLFVALASNKLLLASPGKDYVIDALKRDRERKKPALNNAAFQAVVERLDTKQSLAIAFLGKSLANAKANNDAVPRFLAEAIGSIEAIGGGLNVTNEIKLDILLAGKDSDGARRMQMALDRGLKMALVGLSLLGEERKELSLLLDVVKSMKVTARGKVVTVTGRLTQDVIEDFFKKDG